MERYSAHFVVDIQGGTIEKYGIVTVNSGALEVVSSSGRATEQARMSFFSGIIITEKISQTQLRSIVNREEKRISEQNIDAESPKQDIEALLNSIERGLKDCSEPRELGLTLITGADLQRLRVLPGVKIRVLI